MIRKIDHVGIAVPSIPEALKLYEVLGLEVEGYEDVPAEGVRVAMIRCGESRIELLEATRDDSPIARFIATRGGGVHHICLATTDVQADQASLQAAGVRVLRPEPSRVLGLGTSLDVIRNGATGLDQKESRGPA